MENCQKVKPELPHDPSIPVLSTQPRVYKSCQVNEIVTAEYMKATKIVESLLLKMLYRCIEGFVNPISMSWVFSLPVDGEHPVSWSP